MTQLANFAPNTQLSFPGIQAPVEKGDQISQILPRLAKYAEQQRWIVLLSPEMSLPESVLLGYGIDPNKVLVVHPTQQMTKQQILNRLLAYQTASAIVIWNDQLLDSPEVSSTRVFQILTDEQVNTSALQTTTSCTNNRPQSGWYRRCPDSNLVTGPWS